MSHRLYSVVLSTSENYYFLITLANGSVKVTLFKSNQTGQLDDDIMKCPRTILLPFHQP